MIILKIASKQFFTTESAIERARRLKLAQNLFLYMHICSVVVLSYLHAIFERPCPQKDFLPACLLLAACLLLLKCVPHPQTLSGRINLDKVNPAR